MIKDNLARVQDQITSICNKLGKKFDEVTLVGVTKFAQASDVQQAIDAGLTDIGENRVQDAQQKFRDLSALSGLITVRRHLIGHLQTNKLKVAMDCFDLIQSVDRIRLAAEIQKVAQAQNRIVNILLQVNTAREPQKYGFEPEEFKRSLEEISEFDHLNIQGLMVIAPLTDDDTVIRKAFRDLSDLYAWVKSNYSGARTMDLKYLSMGMTNDFPIALQEGANMIRVGRAIFHDN